MPAAPTLTLTFPEPDIALVSFDMPGKGANLLSASVVAELADVLDQLERREDLAGLIIRSTKPGSFIAGADIREFPMHEVDREQARALCRRGQALLSRLTRVPFLSVAAIDGACLGGGAELALWCDRRIVSSGPRTEFGLPEVKLGLIPGWGGTARLSRLIGLAPAVEMVVGGEPIDARAAVACGLATDVVAPESLLDVAVRLVRDERRNEPGESPVPRYLHDRRRLRAPIALPEPERELLRLAVSAQIHDQTKGFVPAPQVALELMLEAASLDLDAACEREVEAIAQLFGSPVNRALVNVFFLHDRGKRDVAPAGGAVRPLRKLGVVGAGVMGAGIAAATLRRELPVVLYDASVESLGRCVQALPAELAYDKRTRRADPERAARLASQLVASSDLSSLADCDLTIEAIVENADVKQSLFARLEPLLGADAVLASNTSTIPITRLAEKLVRPDRFCGVHFFNPVRRMQLVEIIRGEQTSDATIAAAVAYVKRLGKLPIVVKDGPGFLVNRLLRSYLNEALQLLTEGSPMADIEQASFAFGMPIGPFTLYDMVGIDTAFYAGRTMYEAFPDRVVASPILPALIKAGRLGQKNGLGFFSYQNKEGRPRHDPIVDKLLAIYLRNERQADPREITARLFLPMLLEATRVLEEGRVGDVRDIDLGVIFGLGFPAFRGGLMYWGDTLGAAEIVEQLKAIAFLGPRVQPTDLLLEMAASGRKFYA